jgi:hypothetical protein
MEFPKPNKMTAKSPPTVEATQQQRLLGLFGRLLPVVDGLADRLRAVLVLGLLVSLWLVAWCFGLKHFSIAASAAVGVAALLPTLVLARFWWALEELKKLPEIAAEAAGDAKAELQASMQSVRVGKAPKLGLFSIGKSFWSLGAMASEVRELAGTYLSIATLVNPFMLALGIFSFVSVFVLVLAGILLAFFI